MKKSTTILLRVLAGLFGAAILCFLMLFAFSFLGNPITSMVAEQKISDHINQNFSFLRLERKKVFYNFKDGCYHMQVQDEASRDTHFSISYNPRTRTTNDDYAFRVSNGSNTWMRMEEKYAFILEARIRDYLAGRDSGYTCRTVNLMPNKEEEPEALPLDAAFDKAYLKDHAVSISLVCPDFPADVQKTARLMQELYQALEQQGDIFPAYTLYLDYSQDSLDDSTVRLAGITNAFPQDLEASDFPQRAEELVEDYQHKLDGLTHVYADFNPPQDKKDLKTD